MPLRRIVLIRHGETDGNSSERYHGSTDVALSSEGERQMRVASASLGSEEFDLIVASSLKRSWQAAWLVSGGAPLRMEAGFRERHFGRWEGLTRQEIQAQDPALYEDWQNGAEGFEFPGGETNADFSARVGETLQALLAAHGNSALAVLHKGVIKEIVRRLGGDPFEGDAPALGEVVVLTRLPDGSWIRGRRGSNPPGLDEAA